MGRNLHGKQKILADQIRFQVVKTANWPNSGSSQFTRALRTEPIANLVGM